MWRVRNERGFTTTHARVTVAAAGRGELKRIDRSIDRSDAQRRRAVAAAARGDLRHERCVRERLEVEQVEVAALERAADRLLSTGWLRKAIMM